MKQVVKTNFDSVAFLYDGMAKLVFGNRLLEAQCHFLHQVKPYSQVLILGGGSGELLERLLRLQPACSVCYIDSSEKMIALSQKRVGQLNNVTFIQGTENSIPADRQFDVIITNFYLDLFTPESLTKVVETIKGHLKSTGIWLATDFANTSSIIDTVMLRVMYAFFRMVSKIEASRLPDWEGELRKYFREIESKSFRRGFIRSLVFRDGSLHQPVAAVS